MMYEFLCVISLLLVLVSVILMVISSTRFLKGEFKKVLIWIVLGLIFMALPYCLYIIQKLFNFQSNDLIIFLFMTIVALFLLRASYLLFNFSNKYGFAKK